MKRVQTNVDILRAHRVHALGDEHREQIASALLRENFHKIEALIRNEKALIADKKLSRSMYAANETGKL